MPSSPSVSSSKLLPTSVSYQKIIAFSTVAWLAAEALNFFGRELQNRYHIFSHNLSAGRCITQFTVNAASLLLVNHKMASLLPRPLCMAISLIPLLREYWNSSKTHLDPFAKTANLTSIQASSIAELQKKIASCNEKGIDSLEIILSEFNTIDSLDIFQEISKVYPNLKTLSLIADDANGFPMQFSKGFDALSHLKDLKNLKLKNCSANSLSIAGHPAIETLVIEDCTFTQFPAQIGGLTKLHTLTCARNLFGEGLDENEIEKRYVHILENLKKSLIYLCLQDFRLANLPKILTNSLKDFTKLTTLDVRKNPFSITSESFTNRLSYQSILYENEIPRKELPGQNLLLVGRSRSGKSTIQDVLRGEFVAQKMNIFASTREPTLTTLEIPNGEGTPFQLNIQDTPGLFEKTAVNSSLAARSNKNLLDLIFTQSMEFFGGNSFRNVHHVMFAFSIVTGISQEDIDSLMIIISFLRRMGLPNAAKIFLVITRCEGKAQSYYTDIISQLEKHPKVGLFLQKENCQILFSGAISSDLNLSPSAQSNLEKDIKHFRTTMLEALFNS